MSPDNQEFLNYVLEACFIVLIVIIVAKMVDLFFVAFKYRKLANETDWENQFQVQRLVNELVYDEKVEKGLKKGFLQALAEDCRRFGYDNLAEKAEQEAEKIK